MKLIIHDLESREFQKIFPHPLDGIMVIGDDGTIRHCLGCFGCWLKTPAACVIRDKYGDTGECLSKCTEVLIISKCCYGGFSPFVKNVLDRSISHMHPYFVNRNGKRNKVQSYTTKHTNGNIAIVGNKIKLPKLGFIRFAKSREIEGLFSRWYARTVIATLAYGIGLAPIATLSGSGM